MKNFQVYKHPFYGFECIKIGFSWPAFFFGLFWMLLSRLWLNAFMWIVIYLITIYISETQIENIVFQLVEMLIYLALWLVPAFEGNNWRITKLRSRGFEFLKIVQAASKDEAIAQALNEESDKLEHQSSLSQVNSSPNSANELIFSHQPSNQSRKGQGAYVVGSIIALFCLFFSLIISKPNERDFVNYLLNENRIQSALSAEIKPGDVLAATALIGDFFDFIASG